MSATASRLGSGSWPRWCSRPHVGVRLDQLVGDRLEFGFLQPDVGGHRWRLSVEWRRPRNASYTAAAGADNEPVRSLRPAHPAGPAKTNDPACGGGSDCRVRGQVILDAVVRDRLGKPFGFRGLRNRAASRSRLWHGGCNSSGRQEQQPNEPNGLKGEAAPTARPVSSSEQTTWDSPAEGRGRRRPRWSCFGSPQSTKDTEARESKHRSRGCPVCDSRRLDVLCALRRIRFYTSSCFVSRKR